MMNSYPTSSSVRRSVGLSVRRSVRRLSKTANSSKFKYIQINSSKFKKMQENSPLFATDGRVTALFYTTSSLMFFLGHFYSFS